MTAIHIPPGTQTNLQAQAEAKKEIYSAIVAMTISDEASYAGAAEILVEVKKQAKELATKRTSVTEPLNGVLKEVRSWFKPAEDYLAMCEAHLKKIMGDYQLEVQRKNQEAIQALAAAAQQQNAMQVSAAVDKIVDVPKAQNTSTRMIWDWELVDATQVPREFLSVDPSKVAAYVKASGDHTPAPVSGIRFFQKAQIIARTR